MINLLSQYLLQDISVHTQRKNASMTASLEVNRPAIGTDAPAFAEEASYIKLAGRIVALTESSSPLITRPLPEDDPRQRQPDISLARSALAWQPTVELAQGLPRTIEYFRALIKKGLA